MFQADDDLFCRHLAFARRAGCIEQHQAFQEPQHQPPPVFLCTPPQDYQPQLLPILLEHTVIPDLDPLPATASGGAFVCRVLP